jgi:tRNA nucleotidyltransferase (CCA-adding enzyme)
MVRHHGTHPDPGWSDPACRRFLKRLLEDGLPLDQWAAFRFADQAGKGFGEQPFRAAHEAMLARLQALADQEPPLRVQDLALDGRELAALAGRPTGPWLGRLQLALLEEVLDDPALNSPELLKAQALEWLAG